MLPGFRFLFAAVVLAMSVMVFGLGAAALLRAAHEQFASIPSRRPTPEPVFAQPSEPAMPTLALLRFEPPVAENAPDEAAAVTPAETETPATPAADAAPTEPEKLAALNPEEAASAEPMKPEMPEVESTPVAPVVEAETPAANDEAKVAVAAETPEPAAVAPLSTPEAVAEVLPPEGNVAATKVATLGAPAVTIKDPAPAKATSAKPDRNAIRKRAQRIRERRRIAARRAALAALQAQQAAAQQQADPFGQPAPARAK